MHQCFVLWASRNLSFYFSRYIFNLICILFQNYQIMKSQIMMILITNILQISDGNTIKGICTVHSSVGIFPGTFPIFKSRDFWTSLVPGQQDHGTFKVSRSCPVLSRDLGPLVPGLPGTSRDLFGRLLVKKKSIQRYMFFYFCKFFLAKLSIFDCEP